MYQFPDGSIVEARLLRIHEGQVLFELPDGTRKSFAESEFREGYRDFLRKQLNLATADSSGPDVSQEVRGIVEELISREIEAQREPIRTWTSENGQTLDARIVGMVHNQPVLRTPSGAQRSVDLDILSRDDQHYARDWYVENILSLEMLNDLSMAVVKIEAERQVTDEIPGQAPPADDRYFQAPAGATDSAGKPVSAPIKSLNPEELGRIKRENYGYYEVTLINRGSNDLPPLEAEIFTFKETVTPQRGGFLRNVHLEEPAMAGTVKILPIPARGRTTFLTPVTPLYDTEPEEFTEITQQVDPETEEISEVEKTTKKGKEMREILAGYVINIYALVDFHSTAENNQTDADADANADAQSGQRRVLVAHVAQPDALVNRVPLLYEELVEIYGEPIPPAGNTSAERIGTLEAANLKRQQRRQAQQDARQARIDAALTEIRGAPVVDGVTVDPDELTDPAPDETVTNQEKNNDNDDADHLDDDGAPKMIDRLIEELEDDHD